MSRYVLAPLLVVCACALAPDAAGQDGVGQDEVEWDAVERDAVEWDRAYDRVVPRLSGEIEPGQRFGTRVIDALTRQPVAGATVLRYTEMSGPRAELLDVATTDRHGIVAFSTGFWTADCHWIVRKEGYAPAHDYGAVPGREIELERGTAVDVQVVDAFGEPLRDAAVEYFMGCSHGPTVYEPVPDAGGRFRLPAVHLPDSRLWVESPTTAADVLVLEDALALGARGRPLLHAPGGVLRGRVVDLLGNPLVGVQISPIQDSRGPYAYSGDDGRFEVRGMEMQLDLRIWHWLRDDALFLEEARPTDDVPLTIRMSPLGFAQPEATGSAAFRVLAGGKQPPDGVSVRMLSLADGWTYSGYFDGEEDEAAEFEDLPVGRYRVLPDGRLERLSFPPQEVVVRKGVTTRADLAGRVQARLRIVGDVPSDATTHLVVVGEREIVADPDDTWLPHDGRASVAVSPDGTSHFFHFAVGPSVEGTRTATVSLPAAHRVRIVGDYEEAELTYLGGEVDARWDDDDRDVLETYATGGLSLDVKLADGVYESYAVTLPDGTATEVVVDLERDRPAQDAVVRLSTAGVSLDDVELRAFHGEHRALQTDLETGSAWTARVRSPCTVYATRTGYQPLRATTDGPGETRLAWGACAVRVRLRDEDGEPLGADLIVDGEHHVDDEGVAEVAGLGPGPHVLLVLPDDAAYVARELRVVLVDGETREIELVISER